MVLRYRSLRCGLVLILGKCGCLNANVYGITVQVIEVWPTSKHNSLIHWGMWEDGLG